MADTKKEQIKELLDRGVENVYPNREFLEKLLNSDKKLKLYLGVDPTGPTLHLGHAIVLNKLKQFQDLGHQVILLIGSFTAMIGDPTDKKAARNQMTRNEVMDNCKNYKEQAAKILDFEGDNAVEIKFNHEW
ncbi:MAG: tyrosine--tRNA ligase, partial [Parcubacteria group bacterium]|nr:tyrosine--tRNA ligase [Parcubacteria group bacterium]